MNIQEFLSACSNADGFARQNRYEVIIPTLTLATNSTKIAALTANSQDGGTDWMNGDYFDSDVSAMQKELTAFCEKSQLPSYQFQLETSRHYGPAFKIPHLPEYQDITMSFMCGSNMLERYFFESWMYMIMDPQTNNFNYISEYGVDIDIIQYKEKATSKSLNVGGILSDNLKNVGATEWQRGGQSLPEGAIGRLGQDNTFAYTLDTNYYTTLVDAYPISVAPQELGYDINNTIQRLEVTFTYKFALAFNGKDTTTGMAARGNQQAFRQTISGAGTKGLDQNGTPISQR